MNKTYFTFLILTFLTLTYCANNSINQHQKIGKQVFKMLKNLDTKSKADFIGGFLSIAEMRELGRNENIITKEKTRNQMNSMSKKDWFARIEEDYNDIKKKGIGYGINWQEIEYVDFVYELITDDGYKRCKGLLVFICNGKVYNIDSTSIFDGTEYKLAKVTKLREVG